MDAPSSTPPDYAYLQNNIPVENALPRSEYIGLVAATLLSSTLSAAGSIAILCLLAVTCRRPLPVFQRLFIALSVHDIGMSIVNISQVFFAPHFDFIGNFLSIGSWKTCQVLATLANVFFIAAPIYNAAIASQFHGAVCRGMTEEDMKRRIELPSHILALLLGVVMPVVIRFSVDDIVAFITIQCITVRNGVVSRLLGNTVIVPVPAVVAIRLTYLVWRRVKRQLELSRRFSVQRMSLPNACDATPPPPSSRLERETSWQAILYCLVFLNSFFWWFLAIILNFFYRDPEEWQTGLYPYKICFSLFYPLQGFWNFFVFIRPRVAQVRRNQPHLHFVQVLKIVFRVNSET